MSVSSTWREELLCISISRSQGRLQDLLFLTPVGLV